MPWTDGPGDGRARFVFRFCRATERSGPNALADKALWQNHQHPRTVASEEAAILQSWHAPGLLTTFHQYMPLSAYAQAGLDATEYCVIIYPPAAATTHSKQMLTSLSHHDGLRFGQLTMSSLRNGFPTCSLSMITAVDMRVVPPSPPGRQCYTASIR